MSLATTTAQLLMEIGAVQLAPHQPFTWASGMLSPIYCDNRVTLSYPQVRTFIRQSLAEASRQFEPFDVVAGVATAGIAHGVLVADELNKPFVYVRSSAKEHGRRNLIEGQLQPGWRALVIEDLISTGGSSIKVVENLRDAGCAVVGVLAIFQYGFESTKAVFEKAGVPFATLTDFPTLIQVAAERHFIAPIDLQTLTAWSKNPQQWGALYA